MKGNREDVENYRITEPFLLEETLKTIKSNHSPCSQVTTKPRP